MAQIVKNQFARGAVYNFYRKAARVFQVDGASRESRADGGGVIGAVVAVIIDPNDHVVRHIFSPFFVPLEHLYCTI